MPAIWLFAIVCLWTPPHFWALALLLKDHYAKAEVPMMPVVRGERKTLRQILGYTAILVAATVVPVATGTFGFLYLGAALALGGLFLVLAWGLFRAPSKRGAAALFHYSLLYLALLFVAAALDPRIERGEPGFPRGPPSPALLRNADGLGTRDVTAVALRGERGRPSAEGTAVDQERSGRVACPGAVARGLPSGRTAPLPRANAPAAALARGLNRGE